MIVMLYMFFGLDGILVDWIVVFDWLILVIMFYIVMFCWYIRKNWGYFLLNGEFYVIFKYLVFVCEILMIFGFVGFVRNIIIFILN